MISTLHIKNIGIIDDLFVDLENGFNVLTGETGAGKTLIVGAIGIITGGRFSKEMIRKGETFSFVEANIYCPESNMSIDGNIIVSREIEQNGRNMCKINGRMVTVSELKECMSKLIDIHGQHDNQNLLNTSNHIKYLDGFIGQEISEIKIQYSKLFEKYNQIKEKLKENYGDNKERERRLDLLQYQFNEIENAKLKSNEIEELEQKHILLKNSEKLQENLKIVEEELNIKAIEGISNSIRCLEKIENCSQDYGEKLAELKSIYYEIQEFSRDISTISENIYFDEYERENVERRLDEIHSLKRKYGNSIEEILEYKEELEEQINYIKNLEEINNKLKKEQEQLKKEMEILCEKLTKIRTKFAIKLSEKINIELTELEMYNATFKVEIRELEHFCENGLNQIEFMICTNKGEESKELTKIASGGEMSRIMLAIKTVLANIDKTPTMIFDEIDTGISGMAAKAVANKMKKLSEKHQIICITHLSTIAAKGDYNYYISKKVEQNHTTTHIQRLSEEETIKEIARISNGDITALAIENAKELRKAV